jgi:hypothetical protein
MIKRQQALAQLNLLRHATIPAVQATAETVLWLDTQLEQKQICSDRFRSIVEQHYCLVNSFEQPVCQVCSHALKELLESENPKHEDI